jgi:NADPH:quinone reductase-like Zn-dependent oxidoreductase
MKAIVHDEYGSAEMLELKEIDRPTVKDGEVLVRVHAAAKKLIGAGNVTAIIDRTYR